LPQAGGHGGDGELARVPLVGLIPADKGDTVASGTPQTEQALAIGWSRAFWW